MPTSGFRVVKRSEEDLEAVHGFKKGWGITAESTGSRNLQMCRGVLPPNTRATPHYHPDSQTAIYILRGRAELYVGPRLEECWEVGPGDFVYIDKGVVHQPVNRSPTEPHEFILVRDTDVEVSIEYDAAARGSESQARSERRRSPVASDS